MKTLLAIALASFATAVSAQTCDLSMSVAMTHKAVVTLKNTADYKGLTAAQAGDIVKRSMSVINEAAKAQDKRGDYSFDFTATDTCGLNKITAMGPVDGLTHKDAVKVWRVAFKVAEQTTKMSEGHVAKGGKGPWGK